MSITAFIEGQPLASDVLREAREALVAAGTAYASRRHQLGVRPGPLDPATLALLQAEREFREATHRVEACGVPDELTWETAQPERVVACSACGHNDDQVARCLGCGDTWCGAHAPAGGGQACPRCCGPVWRAGELLTPPRRNPAMKGW